MSNEMLDDAGVIVLYSSVQRRLTVLYKDVVSCAIYCIQRAEILCNYCRPSITLKSLQLLHKNCIALNAINCT